MVEVNSKKLNEDTEKLSKVNTDYKTNNGYYFDNIIKCDKNWNDLYSDAFFSFVNLQKSKFDTAEDEIDQINDIYSKIARKYYSYGKIVSINYNARAGILSLFDSAKDSINNAISSFESIDTSLPEGSNASSLRSELESLPTLCDSLKKECGLFLEDIKTFEKNIESSIRGFVTQNIYRDDTRDFSENVNTDVDYKTVSMNITNIDNCLLDFEDIMESEEEKITDLYNIINNIFRSYKSISTPLFEKNSKKMIDNLYILKQYHYDNIQFIQEKEKDYLNTFANTVEDLGVKTREELNQIMINNSIVQYVESENRK